MLATLRKQNPAERYTRLLQEGYQQCAYDQLSGTYILIHPNHVANTNLKKGEEELQNNIAQAMAYYKRGVLVELLEAFVRDPSLDAIVGGELFEFEAVTRNKANTIQHRILEAAKQIRRYNEFYSQSNSINISIKIDGLIESHTLIAAIRQALYNGLKVDQLNFVVNERIIYFNWNDLETKRYSGSI